MDVVLGGPGIGVDKNKTNRKKWEWEVCIDC